MHKDFNIKNFQSGLGIIKKLKTKNNNNLHNNILHIFNFYII